MLLVAFIHVALAADADPPQFTNDSWRRLYLEASLPDPHVAYAESLGLGFGAGHFYAHDKVGGFTFLGVEGAGLIAGTTGAVMSQTAYGRNSQANLGYGLLGLGVTTLIVGRIADAITAPHVAHKYAAEQIALQGTQAATP